MSAERRAKYVGASGTGVDLIVPLANGESRSVHVEHGSQLPTEIDGVAVPASFRDELLKQEENWSAVKQAAGRSPARRKRRATKAATKEDRAGNAAAGTQAPDDDSGLPPVEDNDGASGASSTEE